MAPPPSEPLGQTPDAVRMQPLGSPGRAASIVMPKRRHHRQMLEPRPLARSDGCPLRPETQDRPRRRLGPGSRLSGARPSSPPGRAPAEYEPWPHLALVPRPPRPLPFASPTPLLFFLSSWCLAFAPPRRAPDGARVPPTPWGTDACLPRHAHHMLTRLHCRSHESSTSGDRVDSSCEPPERRRQAAPRRRRDRRNPMTRSHGDITRDRGANAGARKKRAKQRQRPPRMKRGRVREREIRREPCRPRARWNARIVGQQRPDAWRPPRGA